MPPLENLRETCLAKFLVAMIANYIVPVSRTMNNELPTVIVNQIIKLAQNSQNVVSVTTEGKERKKDVPRSHIRFISCTC